MRDRVGESVRRPAHPLSMFLVQLTCSDDACTEEIEAVVEDLSELDGFVCDCGFGTVTLSIATVELV
jgi:hypothetical protein